MRKFLPKKSKKGITLVESVIAVVVLGIFSIGILTLLTSGGTKIMQISHESGAYAEATQKLDQVIASISNGSTEYIVKTDNGTETIYSLNADKLNEVGASATISLYDTTKTATVTNVRGWYLELTHNGATVKGFASNSEGVFDH